MSWFIPNAIEAIKNKLNPDRPARLTRQMILATYGDPGAAYNQKYMTMWEIKEKHPWFPQPSGRIYINKEFAEQLDRAFTELEAEGLQSEIKTYDGCFVVRNTRGSSLISLHSWGMAMDLNASLEKLGQVTTNWSDAFIEIMRRHVYWGGDYKGRKDPMHFSLYGE